MTDLSGYDARKVSRHTLTGFSRSDIDTDVSVAAMVYEGGRVLKYFYASADHHRPHSCIKYIDDLFRPYAPQVLPSDTAPFGFGFEGGDCPSDTPCVGWQRKKDYHNVCLVPDFYYTSAHGYQDFLQDGVVPWDMRHTKVFWRGSTTGGYDITPATIGTLLRYRLCTMCKTVGDDADVAFHEVVQAASDADTLLLKDHLRDEGILRPYVPMEGYQNYKFMVQIDGNANSWGLVRKLRLGCCILSVESDWRSFHDKSLHPWVHYVPVKNDLADLNEKIEWCLANQGQAKEIAERGRSFALSIDYDEEMRDTVRSIYSHAQQHKVGPDGDGERRGADGSTIRDGVALNRTMTVFSVDDFGTLTTAGDLAVGGRIASPSIAGSMTVTTGTGQGPTSGLAVQASAGFGINIFPRLGAGHYNPIVGTDDAALVFGLRDEINAHHLTIAAHSSTPGGIRLDNTGAMTLSGTVIISLDSLPTSDPHVAGQLWRSGTALQVSLG